MATYPSIGDPAAVWVPELKAYIDDSVTVTTQAADTGTIPAPGKRVVAVVNPGGWIDDLIVEDI